ncbi:hypothetical protein QAD02_020715 [Eretmocerus hayati]|uniref:Uncharacterized protein n=1 Tax=Eretmocerus hayati TaxID=131215 RepID=A0ACC2PNC6_9HYME|nr:hypothetical protein QAD02_020715 [Eretmocerus hayati]
MQKQFEPKKSKRRSVGTDHVKQPTGELRDCFVSLCKSVTSMEEKDYSFNSISFSDETGFHHKDRKCEYNDRMTAHVSDVLVNDTTVGPEVSMVSPNPNQLPEMVNNNEAYVPEEANTIFLQHDGAPAHHRLTK